MCYLYIIQKKSVYEFFGEFSMARNETCEISCVSRADRENKSTGSKATSFHAKLREERLVNYSELRQSTNPRNRLEERKNSPPIVRRKTRPKKRERLFIRFFPPPPSFSLVFSLFPYISPYLFPFGHKYVNTTVDDSPRR